jgi:putative ABC transport system permease protein
MGIPVLQGRAFNEHDRIGSPDVIIVNRKFADRFFPGQNPIGKKAMFGASDEPEYAEIVGVVGNVNERDVNQKEIGLDIYRPMLQVPMKTVSLAVRTRGSSASVLNEVRNRIRTIDADVSVFDARTVEQVLRQATWDSRLTGSLFSLFALGALMLAGIGLYGVIAYAVHQRTHEIGVRMALGATRQNVIGMVFAQGARFTALGVGIGMALAFALSRVLSTALFGVSSTDPYTFAIVPVLLASVALLATYLPARRATRVNPITALRTD